MKKKIIDDDPVFILAGEDENELYVISDLRVIDKLQAKIKELSGKGESEISQHLRRIVNPQKYGNG